MLGNMNDQASQLARGGTEDRVPPWREFRAAQREQKKTPCHSTCLSRSRSCEHATKFLARDDSVTAAADGQEEVGAGRARVRASLRLRHAGQVSKCGQLVRACVRELARFRH